MTISIANLPTELDSDAKLTAALSKFGHVIRAAIITNPAGAPKGFAIVEFALPSAAAAALAALRRTHEARRLPRSAWRRCTPSPVNAAVYCGCFKCSASACDPTPRCAS